MIGDSLLSGSYGGGGAFKKTTMSITKDSSRKHKHGPRGKTRFAAGAPAEPVGGTYVREDGNPGPGLGPHGGEPYSCQSPVRPTAQERPAELLETQLQVVLYLQRR